MSDPPATPKPADPTARVVARHRGLVGRTALVSVLTLLSRVLGFVREMLTGALFGDTSAVSDAFFTAWRVPNLFRRLFGEGALSTSLQAAVTEEDARGGDAAGRRLFLRTIGLAAGILFFVSVGAMVAVSLLPDRMPVLGWHWLGADPEPVRDLTVRLLPFVLLVCVTALCGGALHVRGHYAAPNLGPTVLNLTWIGALVWVGWRFVWRDDAPVTSLEVQWDMARVLAWGVLFGGVFQLAIHVPALLSFGLLRKEVGVAPQPLASERSAWDVLRASAPLALGAAVYQINVMIDGFMAEALLADGGPTALYYANRVQQFPLALVAVATTSAVFPALKALGHTGRRDELRGLHDRSQLGVVFLALPAAIGLFVLAEPIASVLFERGNYGESGVTRLAAGLRMLALALVPAGAAGLVGRVYYAMGDFRTPVRISSALLVVNVGLNALFVRGLGMDVEGLALATALTSWANLLLLVPGLRRRLGLPAGEERFASRLFPLVIAALLSGAAAWGTHVAASLVLGLEERESLRSFPALLVACGAGALAFFVAAKVLRLPEWEELRRRLRSRSKRSDEGS